MTKHIFSIVKWEQRRRATLKAFIVECILLGMEYSVTFLTLWIYITTLVKTDHPKLFYSVISACYQLSAVIFSIFIGRWVDKTRSVRTTFLVCNFLVIIGNLIYTIHHSPWCLVIGRFCCGIGGPLRSVVSGEVSRCFPSDQVMSKFSAMGMAFSLGFIVGPGVNFIFKDVDIKFSIFHFTMANISGIYMAALFLLAQIYVFVAVHDLSKEYDLKAFEETFHRKQSKPSITVKPPPLITEEQSHEFEESHNSYISSSEDSFHASTVELQEPHFTTKSGPYKHTRSRSINSAVAMNSGWLTSAMQSFHRSIAIDKIEQPSLFPQTFTRADAMLSVSLILVSENMQPQCDGLTIPLMVTPTNPSSVSSILRQIIKSFDVTLIFILSFTMYFWMVTFDMWLPMMVIDVQHMGVTELNGIVFGFGCISAVVLLLLSYKRFSDKALYRLSLICVLALALMEVIFGSMKLFRMHFYVNIVLWITWGIMFAIVVVIDEVFLIGVLAKMTSSRIQTFNESLRLSMTRAGALVALLISAMVFEYVEYMCLAGIIFAFITFLLLVWRKKTFQNPQLVIN